MAGMPVLFEKRTTIGVEGAVKWCAIERVAASGVGVKVPLRTKPLAWAEI